MVLIALERQAVSQGEVYLNAAVNQIIRASLQSFGSDIVGSTYAI